METILSLEKITKSRGRRVLLAGVNLTLKPVELLVLSGPSGSGKTTLLRIIAGLEAPDSGRVLLNDLKASSDGKIHIDPSARSVTMVFQDLALWPNLSVVQNVSLGLSGTRMPRKERIQRARETLDHCGISAFAKNPLSQLSGGELQRVALARALAPRPKLLLLDEPFVFLDVLLKATLFEQFLELRRTYGFTAIVVTHNPADAIAIKADTLAILEDSVISETVTSHRLPNYHPKSRTLRAWSSLFRATPVRSATNQ